ncbi:carboxylating nicotinate-nucleotide diphosphorylase [Nitrosomonas communis]|uniref:Probable nicotinate-nucleotide pyrophosphorylase [carboxylating] n=1 Tax=Nitrosomonas communis TaxID=44574 RepID=A0A1H2XKX7_9PROT|nr:carboxylating nicotinate-nucleotide diphosphorylase [Nitrosomonas communis]SDW93467.1 nicotinate-nucleotide pyrophosphorylase (carboxylating) [Nitrosomonas communis]
MIGYEEIKKQVSLALAEDIGAGDLTALLVPADKTLAASVISREQAILCGAAWFEECFRQLSPMIRISWLAQEGERVQADQKLCEITGNARALLTAERTALNFLQMLSAVATQTRRYVDAISGTDAVIVDTRKTLPGLRLAQKYAVKCGGGINHRFGLYDGILIKENHILATGGIELSLRKAKEITPRNVLIQIEVETLDELQQALHAGAPMILLDNFDPERLRQAVALNQQLTGKRAILEASGNITLVNVHTVAETGVDRISIGSLTKDIKALDLSMRFLPTA